MQLTITPQRGDVTTFTMACDNQIISQIVADPRSFTQPVDQREWLAIQGGTAPMKDQSNGT